ncbi:zinc transporter foi isoform X2 [Copidosoma floridanum]|uniref:zinc transporter foi isoform X2 n=1 Tax=Copidosoma floridanum TaxID=29053 RepID=UPI0006C9BE10|nr:zinc transporter foi isoform X2 [Copidosoma floridanum]
MMVHYSRRWITMAQHFVTVCVVCVLCAAHTPCYAHMNLSSQIAKQIPGEKYPTESLGRSEPLLPLKTETTVLPQLKDFHTKYPKETKSLEHLFSKMPDDKIVKSSVDLIQSYEHISAHKQLSEQELIDKQQELLDSQKELLEKQEELIEKQKYLLEHGTTQQMLEGQKELIDNQMKLIKSRGESIEKYLLLQHLLFKDFTKHHLSPEALRLKRGSKLDDQYFVKKISDHYGNNGKMTIEGFDKLVATMSLFQSEVNISEQEIHSIDSNRSGSPLAGVKDPQSKKESQDGSKNVDKKERCLGSRELLSALSGDEAYESANKNATLPGWLLESVCPALVYQLAVVSDLQRSGCVQVSLEDLAPLPVPDHHHYEKPITSNDMFLVWGCASVSVVAISLVGLVGIAVIPLTSKSYYSHVLQFLVALAVGTLCGDALIHLIPHAMMLGPELNSHSHENHQLHLSLEYLEKQHTLNMWKGLTIVLGVITFFATEKALNIMSEWLKYRKNRRKMPVRVRVMRESDPENSNNVGEKLCKHKYSTYPYCYGEIVPETQDDRHIFKHNHCEKPQTIEEEKPLTCNSTNCNSVSSKIMQNDLDKKNSGEWKLDDSVINDTKKAMDASDIPLNDAEGYTVIIRDHDAKHHGHGHTHNHVHSAPSSMSSVAMMVIMGDGLHNFTDGMAIGAAFYGSLGGGFSTALAVLCHELPHELGDFAVLLKTGMSVRQAVLYNLLSSILCFMGMILGIVFGAVFDSISWVFSLTAGIFLYIALVDLMPELSSNHSIKQGAHWQFLIQTAGMITGFALMLIIALYEHDLQHIFNS